MDVVEATHTLITYPVPEDPLDLIRRVLAPAGINPPHHEAELHVAAHAADVAGAFVSDFVDIVKHDNFARLPGIRAW